MDNYGLINCRSYIRGGENNSIIGNFDDNINAESINLNLNIVLCIVVLVLVSSPINIPATIINYSLGNPYEFIPTQW